MLMALLVASLLLAALAPVMTKRMDEAKLNISGVGAAQYDKDAIVTIFNNDEVFNVPNDVNAVKVTMIGGGGAGGNSFYGKQEVTTSKSWIVPEGVTKLRVFMLGGGGGGASGGLGVGRAYGAAPAFKINNQSVEKKEPGEYKLTDLITVSEGYKSPALAQSCLDSGKTAWIDAESGKEILPNVKLSKYYAPAEGGVKFTNLYACGGGGGGGGGSCNGSSGGAGGAGGYLSNKSLTTTIGAESIYIKIGGGGGGGGGGWLLMNCPSMNGGIYAGGGGGSSRKESNFQCFWGGTGGADSNGVSGGNGGSITAMAGHPRTLSISDNRGPGGNYGGYGTIWGGGGGGYGTASSGNACASGGGGGGGPTTISTARGTSGTILFQVGGGGGGGSGKYEGVSGGGGGGGGYGGGGGGYGSGYTSVSNGASYISALIGGGKGNSGISQGGGGGYGGGTANGVSAGTISGNVFGENNCNGGNAGSGGSGGSVGKTGAIKFNISADISENPQAFYCEYNMPANGSGGGGAGQLVVGEINVTPGETLYFEIGGGGVSQTTAGKNGNAGYSTKIRRSDPSGTVIAEALGGLAGQYSSAESTESQGGGYRTNLAIGQGQTLSDNWTGVSFNQNSNAGSNGKLANALINKGYGGQGGNSINIKGETLSGGQGGNSVKNGASPDIKAYGAGGGGGSGAQTAGDSHGIGASGAAGYIYFEYGGSNGGGGTMGEMITKLLTNIKAGTEMQIKIGKGGDNAAGGTGGETSIQYQSGASTKTIKARGGIRGNDGLVKDTHGAIQKLPNTYANYKDDNAATVHGQGGAPTYGGIGGYTEALYENADGTWAAYIKAKDGTIAGPILGGCGGNLTNIAGGILCNEAANTPNGKNGLFGGGGGGGAVVNEVGGLGGKGGDGVVILEYKSTSI